MSDNTEEYERYTQIAKERPAKVETQKETSPFFNSFPFCKNAARKFLFKSEVSAVRHFGKPQNVGGNVNQQPDDLLL